MKEPDPAKELTEFDKYYKELLDKKRKEELSPLKDAQSLKPEEAEKLKGFKVDYKTYYN